MDYNFDNHQSNAQQQMAAASMLKQESFSSERLDAQLTQSIQVERDEKSSYQPCEQIKTSVTEQNNMISRLEADICSPTQISAQEFDQMSFNSSKNFEMNQAYQQNQQQINGLFTPKQTSSYMQQVQDSTKVYQVNQSAMVTQQPTHGHNMNTEMSGGGGNINQLVAIRQQHDDRNIYQSLHMNQDSAQCNQQQVQESALKATMNNSKTTSSSPIQNVLPNVNGSNEFNQHMTNQIQTGNQNNFVETQDDRLIIKIDGGIHLVDSIVQFKRTKQGVPYFKLAMCCQCCKSKSFWISKAVIQNQACASLKYLASQVEEWHLDGIDIQSQKTNEQEDDEDEEDEDMDARKIHSWVNESNFKNFSLELVDCKKNQINLNDRYNQNLPNTNYLGSTQQRVNKTTNSVKFADDDLHHQKAQINNRRGRCSIAKINYNKSQSVFNCKTVRKSTDARRRGGATDDDIQFQHCETENPKQACTKLSQNHSLVSNKSLVSGYGCAGTAAFYYNYDDCTNGAMNELVTPPYFNFSEEDGEHAADVNLVDQKTSHLGQLERSNHKVDVDNDIGMEDDISMICEIQADKQEHSQYQIISQGTHTNHYGNNDSPLGNAISGLSIHNYDERTRSIHDLRDNICNISNTTNTINIQKSKLQLGRGTTTSQGGINQGGVLSIYKTQKKFDHLPFAKRSIDQFKGGSKQQLYQPYSGGQNAGQNQQPKSKKRKRQGQHINAFHQQQQHQGVHGETGAAEMGADLFDLRTVQSELSDNQGQLRQPFRGYPPILKKIKTQQNNSRRSVIVGPTVNANPTNSGSQMVFRFSQQQQSPSQPPPQFDPSSTQSVQQATFHLGLIQTQQQQQQQQQQAQSLVGVQQPGQIPQQSSTGQGIDGIGNPQGNFDNSRASGGFSSLMDIPLHQWADDQHQQQQQNIGQHRQHIGYLLSASQPTASSHGQGVDCQQQQKSNQQQQQQQ